MLRLLIALGCTLLMVPSCKKKETSPADAGARAVSLPIAPAPPPAKIVTPAPTPKYKGAPTPGETVADPEDVE